jgi:hypothetical protein
MKRLLFISLFIMVSLSSYAQKDTVGLNIPIKEGKIVYEGIIETPNKTKIDLYNNAKQWFVDYFKSSKDVIQNEDKDQGRIIGKGIIFIYWKALGMKGSYNDKITIQIDVKDGKYRYRIYDMVITTPASYNSMLGEIPSHDYVPEDMIGKLTGSGKFPTTKNQCRNLLQSMDTETKSTIESLQKAMSAKSDSF